MPNESVPMNKRFGLESDTESRAKKFVLDAYTKFSDRTGLEEKWEEADKIYNCVSMNKAYNGTADLFPPDTRNACRSLANFIDETIFSQNPKFQVRGVGGKGDNSRADVIWAMLDLQQERCKVRMKLREMLIGYLIKYGVAIVRVVWRINEKRVIPLLAEREKLKKMLAGGEVEAIKADMKTVYDNVDFQVKDIHNMFWNYFQPWEDQKIIIERSVVDEAHLRLMEKLGIYRNIDSVVGGHSTAKEKSDGKSADDKYAHVKDLTGLSSSFDIEENKQHEILEAECSFDLDGDGLEEECVITVADRETVIRIEPNPYDIQEKTYLWCCWEGIEGTSLGQGVPQLCKKSQAALNDFVNQIMDNITAILNSMWIVDSLAEIPDIELKSRPNGIIRSKAGVDAVKSVVPALTAGEGLKAVMMQKDEIRTASGATMSLQGLPARYGTTASEYQAQGSASARDIFAKIREIEDRIIKEFLRKFFHYDMQFLSREDFIKIIGEKAAVAMIGSVESGETKEVKDALYGDWDFVPLGATQLENKVIKGQQAINFLNIAAGLPPGIVDIPKLVAKAWKYSGDDDDIILPQAKAQMLSPEDENILMAQGEPVSVHPMDPHMAHVQIHSSAIIPAEFEAGRKKHLSEHMMLMQAQIQSQGSPRPPQEQARMGPDPITPEKIGSVPGLPVESL